ncbi:ATP-binding protein [Streptomyces purpureus]|uniref:ATP-binding protein n=1 Tax=Streptomyces purpureus TaxID=1951 RepID=UPI0037B366E0
MLTGHRRRQDGTKQQITGRPRHRAALRPVTAIATTSRTGKQSSENLRTADNGRGRQDTHRRRPRRCGLPGRLLGLDDMVRNLKTAEETGRLTSKLGTYLRPSVLVVDEVGYQPLERAEANLVFQVISKRYERGSIILTSNKTFSEWGQVFGDEVLATAILDRLLHHCDVISINGPSYRLKNRLMAIERENDVA